MKYKHFPQANIVLQAGSNENTVGLRAEKCAGPAELYKPNTVFYASQFEYEDEEKEIIKEHLKKVFPDADFPTLDKIVDNLPPVWIISMHTWAPKIISILGPGNLGYTHVTVPPSPKDN